MTAGWLWIPIVLAAAAAQTVRNAAQKSLTRSAGTLPATFVRFVYGLPFAIVGFAIAASLSPVQVPAPHAAFLGSIAVGAIAQLVATAFLLAAMEQRSFIVAVAFSKTEVLQVALFSALLLGEAVTPAAAAAIAVATVGVVLLSVKGAGDRGTTLASWFSPAAWLGLASGASFALSAIGYRASSLAIPGTPPWLAGPYALVIAQAMQSVLLGAWLAATDRRGLVQVIVAWRVSLLAGFMGAAASTGWLTAFAMRNAADVRTVGLVEVLYSYGVSRLMLGERVVPREIAGIALVAAGIVVISLLA